jgi:hypothetical protein
MLAGDNRKRRFGLLIMLLCPILALLSIPRNEDLSVGKRAHRLIAAGQWTPLRMAGMIPYQWLPDGGHVLTVQQGAPCLVDTATGAVTPLTAVRKALESHPGLAALAPRDWVVSPDGEWVLSRVVTGGNDSNVGYLPFMAWGKWIAVKRDGSAVITDKAVFSRDTQVIWPPGQPEWIAITPQPRFLAAIHYPLADHGTPKTVVLQPHTLFEDPVVPLGTIGSGRLVLAAWYRSGHIEVLDSESSGISLEHYQIHFPSGALAVEAEISPRGDRIAWLFDFHAFSPLTPLRRVLPFLHQAAGQTHGEIWVSDIHGDEMHPLITGGSGAQADDPHFVRWTPDQSRISFVCRDSLYTVPAT